MRHAHGCMLVSYGNRGRDIRARGHRFGQAFDYRRKVRSGIGEHIIHAKRFQALEYRAARSHAD